MTDVPLDLDALEKLWAYLQIDKSDFHLYDWNEGDEYGRIAIGILYNDTPICEAHHVEAYQGQQLIKLLKTIPRLIELARLGQEADKPQEKPVWFDGLYWQKKDE